MRAAARILPLIAVVLVAGCSADDPDHAAVLGDVIRSAPTTTAEPVIAPEDPAALAVHLIRIEQAIREPSTGAPVLRELGRTQQSAYAVAARHPEWKQAVLDATPATLRPAIEANIRAGEELRALAPPPKPELPAWRIVAPAPPDELLSEYHQAEAATGVGWEYLAAIHLVETRMGRIRGTSVAGARGPMQFIPSTWDIYGAGGDIESNHDAIQAAARMLKERGAPGNMSRALYAYNPSNHYVAAISAYAEVMRAEPRTYFAYHGWQVFYGDRLLPEGYGS